MFRQGRPPPSRAIPAARSPEGVFQPPCRVRYYGVVGVPPWRSPSTRRQRPQHIVRADIEASAGRRWCERVYNRAVAMRRRPFDPWRDRYPAVKRLMAARKAGATLRQAAAAAGVHVATVCRWVARVPPLTGILSTLARVARRRRYAAKPDRRPRVPWHRSYPVCGAEVCVRVTWEGLGFAFWRCSRWPDCPLASWRPRHPEDCPACRGPRYWSHSRLSVHCQRCGTRTSGSKVSYNAPRTCVFRLSSTTRTTAAGQETSTNALRNGANTW